MFCLNHAVIRRTVSDFAQCSFHKLFCVASFRELEDEDVVLLNMRCLNLRRDRFSRQINGFDVIDRLAVDQRTAKSRH